MEQGVWQEIELLYQKFQKLGISEAVDYDKYYLYSLGNVGLAVQMEQLIKASSPFVKIPAEIQLLHNRKAAVHIRSQIQIHCAHQTGGQGHIHKSGSAYEPCNKIILGQRTCKRTDLIRHGSFL